MCVDTLGNVTAGMAEDTAFSRFIGPGIIKQSGYRMPTVMSCMAIGMNAMHDRPPKCAVPAIVVVVAGAVSYQVLSRHLHPGGYERLNPVMYGYRSDAGLCF